MDIPEEILKNTKIAIEAREKQEKADREQVEKLQISEPVKQWVKNQENPLTGRDLKPKKLSQL